MVMTSGAHHPPRAAEWLLDRFLPSADQGVVLGDLEEEFHERCSTDGEREARRWYWAQVLRSVPAFAGQSIYWSLPMLRNYLAVAWRNLLRYRIYASINITGLALGLACAMLIVLYARNELRYDRFHEHADRIYRVVFDMGSSGNVLRMANGPTGIGPVIEAELPDVEAVTRLYATGATVRYEDRRYQEDHLVFADSTVFDVFTFPLVEGNPATALTAPHTVVLTESVARKYFGAENPVGQTLEIDEEDTYTITGVMRDVPPQSHVEVDFLAALHSLPLSREPDWLSGTVYTYVVLQEGARPSQVEAKFPALLEKHVGGLVESMFGQSLQEVLDTGQATYRAGLQPLEDIYLKSGRDFEIGPTSSMAYVYVYTAIGLFILFIACINFVNLATARSAHRAREVGMRKVVGAHRGQLVRQFLGESVFTSLLAAAVGMGLAAFTAEQSARQIGIRKVLGASVTTLVVGLTKDVIGLVAVAIGIAAPLTYLAMTRWLQQFAYRVDVGVSAVIGAGLLTLLVAGLTVAYQSFKAARANPVDVLRSE